MIFKSFEIQRDEKIRLWAVLKTDCAGSEEYDVLRDDNFCVFIRERGREGQREGKCEGEREREREKGIVRTKVSGRERGEEREGK